ncbi:MAG: peptidoglycan DD-metalloendopeptidase family protein, partial [Thiohalophilus sp.]
GRMGQSVKAAANGKVVYSGNGLRGYGKLIIIKHNTAYFSAYAYNSKLHVREDDTVKSGQHIADMGNNGSGPAMLHFEIRRNGTPQDPMKYLPKQGS